MKIRFGNFWLASGGVESPVGLSINGQQINDEQQFYLALAVTLQPRGNRSTSIGFSVERNFNSVRLASRFVLTHFDDLPEQAPLYLFVGSDADGEWIRFDDAVVDNSGTQQLGVSVTVAYSFRAARPTVESTAPDTPDPDDAMKASTTAIDAEADEIEVTFAAPFSTTPTLTGLYVIAPVGGDVLSAYLVDGTLSTTGFTARLSAPAPASGYKLGWSAIA